MKKYILFFITLAKRFRPITYLLLASMALLLIPINLVLLGFLNPLNVAGTTVIAGVIVVIPVPAVAGLPVFTGVPAVVSVPTVA
jgi:hypothetical protein